MIDLLNGCIYRIMDENGLALAANDFGFHECDRIVTQPYSYDLNQAWRIEKHQDGTWSLQNLAAGMYFCWMRHYKHARSPFRLVNYAATISLYETEDGLCIGPPDRGLETMGAHQFCVVGTATPLRFELINDGSAELPRMLPQRGDVVSVGVPEIIKDNGKYYMIFDRVTDHWDGSEAVGINVSDNLTHWHEYERLLPLSKPRPFPWMEEHVPNCSIWCPSLIHFGGKYRIYYSITLIYKNTSVIGQLTNDTLDIHDPRYCWKDEGPVLESVETDDFNAIDAHFVRSYEGEIWMVYGSSWTGIKTRKVDEATGKPADDKVYSLAYREEVPHPTEGGYIFKRNGWYYLIVAVERTDQNYRTVVGRSRQIQGPYLDRDGVDMMNEGGTTLAVTKWGLTLPGHASVYQEEDQYYIALESHGERCSGPEMCLSTLTWEDDWPCSAAGFEVLKRFEPEE